MELSSLHPELLLFLSKLRRLYVHENSSGPKNANSVTAISIVSETNHVHSRDKAADSRVIHLSVKEKADAPDEKCQYYLWRQAFPVTPEAKVSGRADVDEWILSLAFPFGKRLKRGTSTVGVFAFLPTSMATNFPFVIQADFILASSRESIVFDSTWNKGILDCVPVAFVNAFTSCVKQGSPLFTVAQAFMFLPSQACPFPELNKTRETIRKKLCDAAIVPCETFNSQKTFCKPSLAVRIHSRFWEILLKMKKKGVSLSGISTIGEYLVHSSLDQDKYGPSLDFLGVHEQLKWYGKCFDACNLISQASDDMYIDLLYFISNHLFYHIPKSCPILKLINEKGEIECCSALDESKEGFEIRYCVEPKLHAWLQKWNLQFGCPNSIYFLPNAIQVSLTRHPKCKKVSTWLLSYAGVRACSVFEYSSKLCNYISHEGKLDNVVMLSHFLYHCKLKSFLMDSEMSSIFQLMPIIDGSGTVRVQRTETLVMASGSKWVKLFGPSNPFIQENFVDISETYAANGEFAGENTPDKLLLSFLILHGRARDLPEISLPNLPLQVASSQMTSEQAFLLLDWIRFHRTRGTNMPERFIESIRSGKWMKTKTGVNCPSNCTIPNQNGKELFELMKDVVSGFAIVDEDFYDDQIGLYIDELKFLGVQCGVDGVQNIVMDRFKLLASSTMERERALSLLLFIGFLKERKMLDEQWLYTMSHARWLKTCKCYAAPRNAVFFKSETEAEAANVVTSLQVVDVKFYGGKLYCFLDELRLLGLQSELEVYSLAMEKFTFPANPLCLTSNCGLFILNCIRNTKSSATSFMEKVCGTPWFKTSTGFKCPSATILHKPDWACLLKIVSVPIIDEAFYGNEIRMYMDELKAIGVAIELGDVLKILVNELKTLLSLPVASDHLIRLLHCITELKKETPSMLADLCECLSKEEILRTRHGHKKPGESILFNSKWACISLFVDLPLIDDSYYGIEIYGLRDELKMLGTLSSLEEGAIYVARGLTKPVDQGLMTAEGTLFLLQCLKILMVDEKAHPFLNTFIDNMMKSELLMTSRGYKLPNDCILFHSAWKEMLELTDATFIDDRYYGTDMSIFIHQLKKIGVKVDIEEVCSALSISLPLISETPTIKRIYCFLKEFNWKPISSESTNLQVWIPTKDSSSDGMWVDSKLCVLHDKAHHFAPILYCLESYYDRELLPFLSNAFHVIEYPSICHFLQIWSLWESRETHEILEAECCFFWGYILKNWNQEMEDTLKSKLTKVPASLPNGSILLVIKDNVFVADNLWLKKMFLESEDSPLFVWQSKSNVFSTVSPSRLCAVYCALGVKKLSDSVKCSVKIMPSLDRPSKDDLKNKLIVKGLLKIILGFLACRIHMPTKQRHELVNSLLSLSVLENDENIRVSYKLLLKDERCLEREVVKLVHWDKRNQLLFIDGAFIKYKKASAEFVNIFAAEIAAGLLQEDITSVVNDLRNLIQMGFLFEFQEHSVQFMLTIENIEVLVEDEEFLAAAFPVARGSSASGIRKRASTQREVLAPLTPSISKQVKRRRSNLDKIAPIGTKKGKSESNSLPPVRKIIIKKTPISRKVKLSSKIKVEAEEPIGKP
ncbi:hypothetical protein BVRB_1g014530 [Beta vulgaris subsp. vulgaris]|nr:hypothetical protein BVRB_1g014530 [Beta vulgaris subsp. vulgaris]